MYCPKMYLYIIGWVFYMGGYNVQEMFGGNMQSYFVYGLQDTQYNYIKMTYVKVACVKVVHVKYVKYTMRM